ncbi:MAG TPA: ATP-binding protein [Myxococcota bacterium]|nr:ATP-binding protein [Myxococcota bacterium]
MKLRTKLLLAQAPLLAALIFVGTVGSLTARELGRGARAILSENYSSVLAAQRMADAAARIDNAALSCIAGECARALPRIAESQRLFEQELRTQEGNVTEPGEAEATARLRLAWQRSSESLARFAQLTRESELRNAYFGELLPEVTEVKRDAESILALNQDAMVRKSDVAERSAQRLNALLVAVVVFGLAVGTLASGALTARLLRPLSVMSQAARRLGEGDVAARALVSGKDELAQVASEFNTMAERLQRYRESTLGQLLAAHRSSQAVIDSLGDPVVVLGVGGEILHLNTAAEGLLELRPDGGLEGTQPALRGVLERVRSHVLNGNGPYVPKGLDEAVRVTAPGGDRRLLPRGTPVYSEQGDVIGASIVLQDVTRLLTFEELRNDLVATVAHEFRTPLTSLRMAIHLLNEQAAGPLSDKQADLLFGARDDCERLQSIVDDLLDISRIQGGKLELHLADVDLESLARAALDAERSVAELAHVSLSCEVLPGQGSVRVDPDRIALVFANLLSNAIRHSPEGGVVRIRARVEGARVRFEVADRGPGVPREYSQAIFDKYFQMPEAPTGGAGLGLFIAREIVRAHGGEIGVENEPGGGACFWFTVARAEPRQDRS